MAVVNKWGGDADLEAGKLADPAKSVGAQTYAFSTTFEVAAGDDNGSIFKIAKLPASAVLTELLIFNDAIADATDYDAGYYDEDEVTEEDKDVLMDGADINAGNGITSPQNGLTNLALEDKPKRVWEILGKTLATKKDGYILALTANAVGSAAGTITVEGKYHQG